MKVSRDRYLGRREMTGKLVRGFNTKLYMIRESRDVNLAYWGSTPLLGALSKMKEIIETTKSTP